MSRELLSRYREALKRQAEAEKVLIDQRIELAVIEKEFGLLALPDRRAARSETDAFIERHRAGLSVDDIDFLAVEYRGGGETAKHACMSESTLRRLADCGRIETRKTDSGHRRYSTVSVMEHLLECREV